MDYSPIKTLYWVIIFSHRFPEEDWDLLWFHSKLPSKCPNCISDNQWFNKQLDPWNFNFADPLKIVSYLDIYIKIKQQQQTGENVNLCYPNHSKVTVY